jgi:hypothetical protein
MQGDTTMSVDNSVLLPDVLATIKGRQAWTII